MPTINIDADTYKTASIAGNASQRSIPRQIAYWAKIGRLAELNPDWTFSMLNGLLQGMAELEAGEHRIHPLD